MTPEALRHLSRSDPVLRRVIRAVGPCLLEPQARSPFESLVRAVAHQQLHGKAAESILRRFIALFPGRKFPRPADVSTVSDEVIRAAGFSRSKIAGIRDLAEKTLVGV